MTTRSVHYAKGDSPQRHHHTCDAIVEPHVETDRGVRWRVVHRCRCGLDNRADAWRTGILAAEEDFTACMAGDWREAAE